MDEYSENLFKIGGYEPFDEPMDVGTVLTFADRAGRSCRIEVLQCVTAFLALERKGFVPDVGDNWRARFDGDGRPPSTENARYTGLQAHPDGICDCCEAECHAIFKDGQDRFLIERWAITTTIMLLIQKDMLPKLPFDWYESLDRHYERICETGRHHYHRREGGPGRV